MTGRNDYQATYRRTERALPLLLGLLALLAGGVVLLLRYGDGRSLETMIFGLAGGFVLAAFLIMATTFRVHRWTIEADGVHIHERPKVPLMGLYRRAVIPFQTIAAFRRVESGFDFLIEIITRDDRRYRMPQAIKANPRGLGTPEPDASLEDFAAVIHAAAEQAGHPLPAASEGLSFWNSVTGLVLLFVMFLIAVGIGGLVAFALWDGFTSTQPRQGEMMAILLLLPFGAGYLLLKSFRRRRAVLAMSRTI